MRIRWLLQVIAAVAAAALARAQGVAPTPVAPTIATGSHLRVTVEGDARVGPLVGHLVTSEDTHLVLDTHTHRWTLRWSQLRLVEVAERRPTMVAAGRGAAGGALVGAVVSAATPGLGAMLLERWTATYHDGNQPGTVADHLMTVATSAAIGFVAGALWNREKWTSLPLPGRGRP